jgi:hypothetical protein
MRPLLLALLLPLVLRPPVSPRRPQHRLTDLNLILISVFRRPPPVDCSSCACPDSRTPWDGTRRATAVMVSRPPPTSGAEAAVSRAFECASSTTSCRWTLIRRALMAMSTRHFLETESSPMITLSGFPSSLHGR